MSVLFYFAILGIKIQHSLRKFALLIVIAAFLIGALALALITIKTGVYLFRVSGCGSSKDVNKTLVSALFLLFKSL